ncbi:outer membrane beta-barrel protein [Croceicoccus marinus]|jgi:hypothetical protein|uniref:Outer membrane beta-barrel protein n=1 Tax=Croceicoccus marinus TaxID=450378 RepID=A0A7G6VT13_9SPHN|nr:outer membrane beta-barrel protein [Croceicoccus marinus]QNE04878.1 outer membrane beta-barrel protein [Croceicoccus marinus]
MLIAVALGSYSSAAAAQDDVIGQSVRDRARTQFAPVPVYLSGFQIRPSIEADIGYDDNIYARNDIRRDDGIVTVSPELNAQRNVGRFDFDLTLDSEHRRYFDTSSENADNFRGIARAGYGERNDTRADLRVSYAIQSEDRSRIDSISDTSVRGRFEDLDADLSASQRFGPFGVRGNLRYRDVDYLDRRNTSGELIDFSFRDFSIHEAGATLSYAPYQNSEIFVAGRYERRDFVEPDPANPNAYPFDRSADGFRVEAGFRQQVSALLFLRMQAGYLRYKFDDPQLQTVSGLAFDAEVLWNVTPLTSIEIRAQRALDENASPDFAGNRRTELAARVDHELLRNLILTADARISHSSPVGGQSSSTRYDGALGAEYLVSRRFRLLASAHHEQRSSNDSNIEFSRNIVRAGLRFVF